MPAVQSPENCQEDAVPASAFKATFDSLPTEINLEILDQLVNTSDIPTQLAGPPLYRSSRHTLNSLSQVNRRLHSLVNQSYNIYDHYEASIHGGHAHQAYLFLRTLITRPHLASRVRALTLEYPNPGDLLQYCPSCETQVCEKLKPSMADKETITAGFEALGILYWRKWAQDCNKTLDLSHTTDFEASRVIGRLYTALIVCAPNLTWLRIRHAGRDPFPEWLSIVDTPDRRVPFSRGRVRTIRRLEHLNIDACGSFGLSWAIPLFHQPFLRKLQLTRLRRPNSYPENVGTYGMPDASSVEDLTLCQSFADMITLSNLVRRCRSLKVFVYIFEDWSRPAPEDYHHLANALASRSTTLEKMYIYDDRTGDELSSLVKDLAQMLTLKHLTLPLASFRHPGGVSDSTLLILGLPPNLEEFTLNCIEEDGHELLLEILRQVLASVPTRLPRLKVVQLWGQEGVDSSAIRGDLDSYLRKDFERRGINLLTSFWEFPTAEAALGEFPVDVEEEMDDASEDDNEGDERFEQAFQASLGVAYAEDGF